jgi:hypothetical protein
MIHSIANSVNNLNQYNRENPPGNLPNVFDNVVRTNGHTIEFIFNVKSSGTEPLPDLETSDIPTADIGRFDAFGVDPGHRHLFTAVNTGGSCTCFSNNE